MSDLRVGVDLMLYSRLGWIGCCNFMAARSGLNQHLSKILLYQNLLLSVNKTPSAKDNDLPKMKHGVGNTGRYMLKCTNLSKDATRHFGMDSNHLVH